MERPRSFLRGALLGASVLLSMVPWAAAGGGSVPTGASAAEKRRAKTQADKAVTVMAESSIRLHRSKNPPERYGFANTNRKKARKKARRRRMRARKAA